jgi:hypothetical protein
VNDLSSSGDPTTVARARRSTGAHRTVTRHAQGCAVLLRSQCCVRDDAARGHDLPLPSSIDGRQGQWPRIVPGQESAALHTPRPLRRRGRR